MQRIGQLVMREKEELGIRAHEAENEARRFQGGCRELERNLEDREKRLSAEAQEVVEERGMILAQVSMCVLKMQGERPCDTFA